MSDFSDAPEITFACDISALTPEQREHHGAASVKLFAAVQIIRETPTGYAFRLPQDSAVLPEVVDFITHERLCCPFFAFNIEVEPHGGAIWFTLSGAEAVKPFIVAEVCQLLPNEVAVTAGLRPTSP